MALQHYDLPSLMAGKLHALITRAYPKGRDWYDLIWYRGQRPPVEPNLTLLQNALDQTEGSEVVEAGNWQAALQQRIREVDNQNLIDDVTPFLERPDEAELLRTENILSVL